jgi:DNA transformation protein and related proteins
MNAEALKELFKPFGEVALKRMFGGYGVYAEGLCFAIESDGEVFLKVDAESQATFSAAGSSPFIYVAKGKPMATSYWRLPAIAHEGADELRHWAWLGLEAARRAAAAKAKPKKAKAARAPAKIAAKSK